MNASRFISGLVPLVVLVPAVLWPGTLVHLVSIAIGVGSAIVRRSVAIVLLTLLSVGCWFLPGLTAVGQWYPVAMSTLLGGYFASTLISGPTVIEKAARIERGGELPPDVARYCRKLTVIWIAFFAVNGGIAFWSVVSGSKEAWALYNGFISYVLAACLFVGERLLRKYFIADSGVRAL